MARTKKDVLYDEELMVLIESHEHLLDDLKADLKKIETQIREYDGKIVREQEDDPALAGAKAAYDWMYAKTGELAMAAKAFDSYLLGGRFMAGLTYDGPGQPIDADKIIRQRTEEANDELMRIRHLNQARRDAEKRRQGGPRA